MAAITAVAPQLAKLLSLLSFDNSGKLTATAAAIGRMA